VTQKRLTPGSSAWSLAGSRSPANAFCPIETSNIKTVYIKNHPELVFINVLAGGKRLVQN
jgi:hypothetical protein